MIPRRALAPFALLLCALGTAGCPAGRTPDADAGADAGPAAARAVQLPPAADGFVARATVYRGEGVDAVVLVHGVGGDQRMWAPLVARMRHAWPARTVLTVDLRGHGESVRRPEGSALRWESLGDTPEGWAATTEDVAAGVRLMLTEGARRVVLVGAGLGATAALRAAAELPQVRGVVMLSPGLAYQGLRVEDAFRAYVASGRPALLWARADDAAAVEGLTALRSIAGAQATTAVLTDSAARGVALAVDEPARWGALRAWIETALRDGPAPPAPPAPPVAPPPAVTN